MFSKHIIKREDGTAYLIRYRIFDCKWFKLRLHHILLSDPDCLHDHPWDFVSIILKGGYFEDSLVYPQFKGPIGYTFFKKKSIQKKSIWYYPGTILYRRAEYCHALKLPNGKTCWTFVIMFRRKREWGFWHKGQFVLHEKYNSNQKCD